MLVGVSRCLGVPCVLADVRLSRGWLVSLTFTSRPASREEFLAMVVVWDGYWLTE